MLREKVAELVRTRLDEKPEYPERNSDWWFSWDDEVERIIAKRTKELGWHPTGGGGLYNSSTQGLEFHWTDKDLEKGIIGGYFLTARKRKELSPHPKMKLKPGESWKDAANRFVNEMKPTLIKYKDYIDPKDKEKEPDGGGEEDPIKLVEKNAKDQINLMEGVKSSIKKISSFEGKEFATAIYKFDTDFNDTQHSDKVAAKVKITYDEKYPHCIVQILYNEDPWDDGSIIFVNPKKDGKLYYAYYPEGDAAPDILKALKTGWAKPISIGDIENGMKKTMKEQEGGRILATEAARTARLKLE